MRKKRLMIAALAAVLCMAAPVYAAEEQQTGVQTEMQLETAEETEVATESEIESESLGHQHLGDIGYEKGVLTEDGWESSYLNMKFIPRDEVLMGVNENDTLQEYHNRNGEENAVASNEMVAITEDEKSYVQVMVEVNPNAEKAEDILARLAKNEKLEETTDVRTTKISGKEFVSMTGTLEDDHYFVAVSTDQSGVAIAIKMKYANAMKKRVLTKGFEAIEVVEDENATEQAAGVEGAAVEDISNVELPAEFEDVQDEVQTEAETGAVTEAVE